MILVAASSVRDAQQALAQEALAQGHDLATAAAAPAVPYYSHTEAAIKDDMAAAAAVLSGAVCVKPRIVRVPEGMPDLRVQQVIESTGNYPLVWSVDVGSSPSGIASAVRSGIYGQLTRSVLVRIGGFQAGDPAAVNATIDAALATGVKFVSFSKCATDLGANHCAPRGVSSESLCAARYEL